MTAQTNGHGVTEACEVRPLFGGALQSSFPSRFQDVSGIRQVPDNQEGFVDGNRDESIIVELLELKQDVSDQGSALWFLQDLATEQDSGNEFDVEAVNTIPPTDVPFLDPSTVMTAAVGKLAVSKGRQGVDARNVVRVHLANLRLRSVNTDVLVIVYEPLFISELSHSASTVGAGTTSNATVSATCAFFEAWVLLGKY